MLKFEFQYRSIMFLTLVSGLMACSSIKPTTSQTDSAPEGKIDWGQVKPAIPKDEPRSRYGNPSSYEQDGKIYTLLASADNHKERGIASWYGTKFHGRRTSSGEEYNMFEMTAAHKTLPIPVYAKVTNLDNGKQIVVKINDRGPFAKGRIIDLSYAAAHKIGMTQKGTANVEIETISYEKKTNLTAHNNTPDKPTQAKQDKKQYVQVGAYAVYETAQKLAKVLDKQIELPVKITSITINSEKLYRVRIGPIPNQTVADQLIKTLDIKELGKPSLIYE